MEAPPPQPPPPGPPAGAPPLPPPSMPTGQAPPPPPPSSQPSGGPDAAAASAPPPAQPPAPAPPMVDPLQANAPKHFEPPNNTIYINNLNEKVKEKELKKSLQAIFEQFGKILQIVAMSSVKRRGQAWVVFDNVDSAKKALAAMQSFPFCGKPMRINYSRNTSDVIAKANGTYQPRAKKPLGPKPTPPGTRPRVALPPAPLPPAPLPGAPAPPPPEDGQPPGKRVKQDPDGGAAPPPPPGAPQAAAPAPPATTMKLMPTEYRQFAFERIVRACCEVMSECERSAIACTYSTLYNMNYTHVTHGRKLPS
eukprot:TRINITY_DN12615_c3_g1_i4.p1 TRINITY_DN12615_c3_g1~~TRINITY_DN12615_c3_g1_i4.p1  ORF type:complete len:308 (+),score=59.36 TRINITY_DN12615_c3_g1_i4:38-961(+)